MMSFWKTRNFSCSTHMAFWWISSGQIIATSPDLTPNGGLVREMGPLISGKSRLVKYYNLARFLVLSKFSKEFGHACHAAFLRGIPIMPGWDSRTLQRPYIEMFFVDVVGTVSKKYFRIFLENNPSPPKGKDNGLPSIIFHFSMSC